MFYDGIGLGGGGGGVVEGVCILGGGFGDDCEDG